MDELTRLIGEARPTLVEVYSPRCSHCVAMEPVIEDLRKHLEGKVAILQIDGTANPDIMTQYKIAAYPCWLLFKDGQVAWRDYGQKPYGELDHLLKEFI